MSVGSHLQTFLEQQTKSRIKLRINDNHSTMLSIRPKEDHIWVSLHRLFLDAPLAILSELAAYISGQVRNLTPKVKSFMESAMERLDYSFRVKPDSLITDGNYFDLKELYREINCDYFNREVKTKITWFGRQNRSTRARVTLGLYSHPMKLVKIHRLLDQPFVPDYVVRFVVFHEMLHHLCPTYHDSLGRHYVHTKEFRQREKKFKQYNEAQLWIDDNQHLLFN